MLPSIHCFQHRQNNHEQAPPLSSRTGRQTDPLALRPPSKRLLDGTTADNERRARLAKWLQLNPTASCGLFAE